MANIVTNIHSNSVYDLVDTVAIGRPGVLDVGMDKVFIARRQGIEPVAYLHPLLEPILKDTEGKSIIPRKQNSCRLYKH